MGERWSDAKPEPAAGRAAPALSILPILSPSQEMLGQEGRSSRLQLLPLPHTAPPCLSHFCSLLAFPGPGGFPALPPHSTAPRRRSRFRPGEKKMKYENSFPFQSRAPSAERGARTEGLGKCKCCTQASEPGSHHMQVSGKGVSLPPLQASACPVHALPAGASAGLQWRRALRAACPCLCCWSGLETTRATGRRRSSVVPTPGCSTVTAVGCSEPEAAPCSVDGSTCSHHTQRLPRGDDCTSLTPGCAQVATPASPPSSCADQPDSSCANPA